VERVSCSRDVQIPLHDHSTESLKPYYLLCDAVLAAARKDYTRTEFCWLVAPTQILTNGTPSTLSPTQTLIAVRNMGADYKSMPHLVGDTEIDTLPNYSCQ
jgi:hypothetical protein